MKRTVSFSLSMLVCSIFFGDVDCHATTSTRAGTFTTLSSDANLAALSLSTGTLSPAFVAAQVVYTASAPYYRNSITVTPTKADTNASITVNGSAVTSGTASAPISLNYGSNTISVIVTAQDGSTKTYAVAVTRGQTFPTAGLVALYHFNGNATDSVGAHHGTVTGATATTDRFGRPGSAYRFNGTSDYIELPDSDVFSVTTTGALVISAWVRPDGTSLNGSNQLLFSAKEGSGYVHWMGKGTAGQHEWAMRIYSADNTDLPSRENRMSAYIFNPAGGNGAGSYFQNALTAGQWIHCVAVINTSTQLIRWYRNGVMVDEDSFAADSSFPVTPGNGTAPLRIGTRDFNSFYAGAVDDLRIYNRGLTDMEVLALYHEDQSGSVDPDFGTNGIVTTSIGTSHDYGQAVAVQSDGKTVVAGFIDSATVNDFALARYNTDGSLDDGGPSDATPADSFGTAGKVITDFAGHSDLGRAVAIQPDNKIVIAGQSYSADGTRRFFALARYNSNGSLDDGGPTDATPGDSFGTGGKVTVGVGPSNDDGRAVVLQSDGKIIVTGSSYNGTVHRFALVRCNANGSLDNGGPTDTTPGDSFGLDGDGMVRTPIGSGHAYGLSVALQTDNKIVVAGSSANSTFDIAVARYDGNGVLDGSFDGDGKLTTPISSGNDEAYGVVVQGDGKIVVGGYAGSAPNSDFALVRYNSNGSLDDGGPSDQTPGDDFGTGGKRTLDIAGGNDVAYGMTPQRDGKFILAGFAHNGSNNDFAVARFDGHGDADNSFHGTGKVATPVGSSHESAQAVALQSDGAIMAAGYAIIGSSSDFALVRYFGGPYPPVIQTVAASNVLLESATLTGTVNPNGLATTAFFEYGITTSYGNSTIPVNIGSGIGAASITADLSDLAPDTLYYFRLSADNSTGSSSAPGTFKTLSLPVGWSNADIGGPVPAGDSSYDPDTDTFSVTGGGSLINRAANSPDKFQYAWQEVTGDFVATVKIESVTFSPNAGAAPRAGLMLRKDTSPTSAYVLAGARRDGTTGGTIITADYWRVHDNDQFFEHSHFNPITLPLWVRITRWGDKVHTEISQDNIHWAQNYGVILDGLPATVCIGFAVASRDPALATTGVFSGFDLTQPLNLAHESSWIGNSFGGAYWSKHVMNAVNDIAIDNSTGTLFMGGEDEARDLHIYDLNGNFNYWGDTNIVRAVAVDGANLFTVGNGNLERWRYDGVRTHQNLLGGVKPTGVAVVGANLYAVDGTAETVRVFAKANLTENAAAAFNVAKPVRIAADTAGFLWVTQDNTGSPDKVLRYSTAGIKQAEEITLFSDSVIAGVSVRVTTGFVYVADRGPRQQIHVFNASGGYQNSIGAQGGIYSTAFGTIPGQPHPLKFNSPVDVEFDASGNMYVACAGASNRWTTGSGTELRKFDAGSNQVWERLGLTYVDSADPVPGTNGTEVYTQNRRFTIDYSQPLGQQWTYAGYTFDPFTYPEDARSTQNQPSGATVRIIGGQKILFVSEMSANWVAMYRFAPGSEIAIPCGLIKRETARGQAGNTFYIWVDTDADGAVDSAEVDTSLTARSEVWGFTIDENGGLWAADKGSDKIRHYPCKGLNAIGAPAYGALYAGTSEREWPVPSDFVGGATVYPLRAVYSAARDELYIGGYRVGREEQVWSWKSAGSCLGRYTGWLGGPQTKQWLIDLPYEPTIKFNPDGNSKSTVACIAVEGDYVFAVFMPTLDVHVYDRFTGAKVQILEAGPEVCGNGALVDIVNGMSALRRSNGEYVIWVEDDATAKINMYRWTAPATAELAIEQPAGTALTDGVSSVAFGNALVGGSATRTFTVRNDGSTSLFALNLTVDGTNAADFVASTLSTTTLIPGASTTFTITFTPSAAGASAATVHLFSNDADEPSFDVALDGTGVAPEIRVFAGSDDSAPELTDNQATAVDFGSTPQGTALLRGFIIKNSGLADLNVSSITLPAGYELESSFTATTLEPGTTVTFQARLIANTAPGAIAGTMQISSNDADESLFDVPITGLIVGPDIAIAENGTSLTDGSNTLIYGETLRGTPMTKTIVVSNTGNAPLNLTNLSLPSGYALVSVFSPATIPVGNSTISYQVKLSALSAGTFTGTLSFVSNDFDEPSFDVALTGLVRAPDIRLFDGATVASPELTDGQITAVPFGQTPLGTPITRSFTIQNSGDADLHVGAITLPSGFQFVGTFTGVTIEPAGTATFQVRATATAGGIFSGNLVLNHDDSDEAPFDVPVTVEVLTPEIRVFNGGNTGSPELASNQAAGLDFGNVLVGSAVTRSITIQNTGNMNLTGLTITQTGANVGDWSVTTSPSSPLAPNGTTTFTVAFQPTALGTRSASLRIASNDADENPFIINLTGVGEAPEIIVLDPDAVPLADGVSNYTFDIIPSGTSSSAKTFTIRNDGNVNLTGITVTKDGANAAEFALNTSGLSSSLAPNATTTFTVAFNPSGNGPRSAALHIASNDANENPFDIVLVAESATMRAELVSGVLRIDDLAGGSNVLVLSQSGANLVISDASAWFSNDTGGVLSGDGHTVTLPLSSIQSIVVNAGAGHDVINIGTFTTALGQITINGDAGNDTINFQGDLNFTSGSDLDADICDDDTPGDFDVINVLPNANLILSGFGDAVLACSGPIRFFPGSSLITQNGDIILSGNQCSAPSSGNFAGIDVDAAEVRSIGSGNVTVEGRGGMSGDGQVGVLVSNGGSITTASGNASITGQGGTGSGSGNDGVRVTGNLSKIDSDTGTVFVTGYGGSGSGSGHNGVLASNGGGIGGGSGATTVYGTGGAGSGGSNSGVAVNGGGKIGYGIGQTIITGTGGSGGTSGNDGIRADGAGSTIGNSTGNTSLTGSAGAGGTSGGVVTKNTGTITGNGAPPAVDSQAATFGANGLTFRGSVLSNGSSTSVVIEFDTDISDGSYANSVPATPSTVNSASAVNVTRLLSTLSSGATYHHRVKATNANGLTYGADIVTAPTPQVAVEQPVGTILSNGSSRDFGSVAVGNTSSVMTFTVRNTGTAPLSSLALSKDGSHPGEFALGNLGSASLAPGASTAFTATFSPTASGSLSAFVHLASNDPDESPFNLTLSGVGTDTTGPVGGTMSLTPTPPVNPSAPLTVAFVEWTDASLPLSYSVLIDDVVVSAQGSSASRNVAAPVTSGPHVLKGRIYDALSNFTEVTRTFTVNTELERWRQQYFGTTTNAGNAADTFDFDKDGLVNLLEWACNLNPTTASALPITTARNGAVFEFTYTRSIAALNAGAAFIVEWSDILVGPTPWSVTGVSQTVLSNNGTVQQVKASVPAGSNGRRFVHLKVTGP